MACAIVRLNILKLREYKKYTALYTADKFFILKLPQY